MTRRRDITTVSSLATVAVSTSHFVCFVTDTRNSNRLQNLFPSYGGQRPALQVPGQRALLDRQKRPLRMQTLPVSEVPPRGHGSFVSVTLAVLLRLINTYVAAIQSDRDKIGFTKRRRKDEDYTHKELSVSVGSPDLSPPDHLIASPSFGSSELELLLDLEQRCSRLRLSTVEFTGALKDAVFKTESVLNDLQLISTSQQVGSVIATVMVDWLLADSENNRLEKRNEGGSGVLASARHHFNDRMGEGSASFPGDVKRRKGGWFEDIVREKQGFQLILLRNNSIAYLMLQQTFYSEDYGPDMMVLPNGAYVHRTPKTPYSTPIPSPTLNFFSFTEYFALS